MTAAGCAASDAGKRAVLFGWVARAPRPRRLRVHRPARSRRPHPGGVRTGDQRRGPRRWPASCAASSASASRASSSSAAATRTPTSPTGEIEVKADALTIFSRAETPPVRDRRRHRRRRDRAAQAPLPRSAPPRAAAELPGALEDLPDHAPDPGRGRLRRDRDAVHGEVHAGRRAQLPGSFAPQPGTVLRARRVTADLQAAVHGRGHAIATSRSCAASATRTCASTASPSSRRSTSR